MSSMSNMNSDILQTVNQRARLAFLKWIPLYEKQKPFQVFTSLPLGVPSTNLVFDKIVFFDWRVGWLLI